MFTDNTKGRYRSFKYYVRVRVIASDSKVPDKSSLHSKVAPARRINEHGLRELREELVAEFVVHRSRYYCGMSPSRAELCSPRSRSGPGTICRAALAVPRRRSVFAGASRSRSSPCRLTKGPTGSLGSFLKLIIHTIIFLHVFFSLQHNF